jgi:hypothetical protein
VEQPAHPWDRTPEESPQAHAALLSYLHQPSGRRSLARLGRELGRSKVLLEGWSSKHAWQARVAEWDRFLQQQRVDATVDEVREMAKRHAQAADYMVAIWLQRAQALIANNQVDELPIAILPSWTSRSGWAGWRGGPRWPARRRRRWGRRWRSCTSCRRG